MKLKSFLANLSIVLVMSVLALSLKPLNALESNFNFTSSPIPYHEFKQGQKDLKVGATALYMTGEIDDPNVSGDVDVYGGGAVIYGRYAARDEVAFDMGFSFMGAQGDIGNNAEMKMTMLSIPIDIEIQPINNDKFGLIFFLGFNITRSYFGIDVNDAGTKSELEITSRLKGPQYGLQASYKTDNFVFSPFVMLIKLAGNSDLDIKENGVTTVSTSLTLSTETSMVYGIDIHYKPLDLTLSSLIQLADTSKSEYKTYFISLSSHFSNAEQQ